MRSPKRSELALGTLVTLVIVVWSWLVRDLDRAREWPGVDEAVIGQIADRAGRSEAGPLLAWVQGDLLLFMFLCAGLLAGFILGYCARIAFVEQLERPDANAAPQQSSPDVTQAQAAEPMATPLGESST